MDFIQFIYTCLGYDFYGRTDFAQLRKAWFHTTPLLNIEITLDGLARKETTDFKNL